MTFTEDIQQWVAIDNQQRKLNERIRDLRCEKHSLNDQIIRYVETNNLSTKTVEISDGRLRFVNTRITTPLTLRYVQKCLNEIISDDNTAEEIFNYIKNNREDKHVQDIKRYSQN
jgi:hypothetical protein